MNRHALICRSILEHPDITQRELAQLLDVSLGTVNNLIKECVAKNFITLTPSSGANYALLADGTTLLETYKVDGALIMAAGFGSRFVPLTFEMPKGLLEVFGERMIERQIKQLHEAGIYHIAIAVGYLKEKFEYLIDKYDVKLLYNPEYSCKNTLATLYHARDFLKGKNMYLLASDNWMRHNMYHAYECGSWYSAVHSVDATSEWCLHFNKKGRITDVQIGGRNSWFMYGPAFCSKQFLEYFLPVLETYYHLPGTEQLYWEHVYMELLNGEARRRFAEAGISLLHEIPVNKLNSELFEMYINKQMDTQVYEFENLEELRIFDPKYQVHSDNTALNLVSKVFQVPESEITNIRCLKSGMTNNSFLFQIHGKHYICRIPGKGTDLLIKRKEEQQVYEVIKQLDISEHILYFDGNTGYKIAEYYEDAHNSDPRNWEDVKKCMQLIRKLHHSGLKVNHSFNMRERIGFYEMLCKSHGSILFEDYNQVHGWMLQLLDQLDSMNRPVTLSHIDSVADNFLFLKDGTLRLIDWEYAGMCDPLIDVAMCAVYSYYNDEETDKLISLYLGREANEEERFVIYAYIALGGFLWSLWAIYKSTLGEEFGEYTIIMYRYAKRYYRKLFQKS